MPVKDNQQEGIKPSPGQPADELQPEIVGVEAEAESLSVELKKPGDGESARRPKKRRSATRWVALLLVVGLAVIGYTQRARVQSFFQAKTADEMTSVGDHSAAEHKPQLKVLYWQDPMHPAYKSDKPGKAPDCGMDLVPVYEEGAGMQSNLPEGAFKISAEKQQLIGVQYGAADYKLVAKTLRTVGRMAYDETKIVRIHPKFEGWIEKVWVDFTGKLVEQGQPLISIYSPELLQTQQEFLLARRGREELAESTFRGAINASESLYQAARKRLELWDINEAQIAELEKSGNPTKTLTLYAPTNGFVLARNAFLKQRVTPETELYSIADLSTIWVLADIYEYEAPEVKLGQTVNITLSYYPGRVYRGKVTYVYPQLDSTTRTLKVRIEVPNPDFALKPDMYANAEVKIDYGRRLVVPQEAVLDSGSEQTIFIAHEGGYFEPRKVQLGAKVDNNFIILGGLKAGERVVTSANFLVDSESKLKSAAGGMGMPGMNHGGGGAANSKPSPQADHSQHQQGAQSA
ncbi:MAG: efflux RND transporter periplasmic adaptor subunit, partial [Acidobacteria bacterium]|nr:efflux RND transporter periplasmic adaptor subunit [Acidobacteriota bacterium]